MKRLLAGLLMLLLLIGGAWVVASSGGILSDTLDTRPIQLSVAVRPAWVNRHDLVEDFEAAYPDVNVRLVAKPPGTGFTPPTENVASHLDAARSYVEQADVTAVMSYNFSAEAVHAGYFLDLKTLTDADETFLPDEYAPQLLESFQWDGGLWALPLSASAVGVVYQADLFSAAGVAAPSAAWSLDDLKQAGSQLLAYGIDEPVFISDSYNTMLLFAGLLQEEQTRLQTPADWHSFFESDRAVELVNDWADLLNAELVSETPSRTLTDVPMLAIDAEFKGAFGTEGALAPLPGGAMGLKLHGFAVNADTAYPEMAYELAKYLSQSPELAESYLYDIRAYQPETAPAISPVAAELADLDRFLPHSQTIYMHYLTRAAGQVADGADATVALQQVQADFNRWIMTDSQQPAISAPAPEPTLIPGQHELTFGGISLLLNPDDPRFKQLVDEFVTSHEEIGRIEFVDYYTTPLEPALQAETIDCFYAPSSIIGMPPYQPYLREVSPLLDDDAAFQWDDVLIERDLFLMADDHLYGIPLSILPVAMIYESSSLTMEMLPETITLSTLRSVLENMQSQTSNDEPPLSIHSSDATGLLALITAESGWTYNPLSTQAISLTDPDFTASVQYVLDLVRDDLIHQPPINLFSGPGSAGSAWQIRNLYDVDVTYLLRHGEETGSDVELQMLPEGDTNTPLIYGVGAGFITRQTPYTDACYQWIQHLAAQGHLFAGMPARASLMNRDAIEQTKTATIADFYTAYQQVLQTDTQVVYPYLADSRFVTQPDKVYSELYWLGRAFDTYLDGTPLVDSLQQAQTHINQYRQCLAEQGNTPTMQATCASTIDPSLRR